MIPDFSHDTGCHSFLNWPQVMETNWLWNWIKKRHKTERLKTKKQRHHFVDRSPSNQSYGLSSSHVRICELTIKKTECQRTDASKLWCWRRLWKVPWTGRRSHLSILKEVNRKYSLEGLMLNLKFQYFGHQMQRANSLAKTLMLGKTEGKRRRGQKRMRW